MTIYGYARVSTDGQTLASQDAQLHAAGCAKVYSEKVSGAKTDRAELAKVLRRLQAGDVLMVTRLDRLARSTRDLLNILDAITKAGAGFKSLGDAWADTTTAHGRLMLTVLGGLAEFERELILARTGDNHRSLRSDAAKKFGPAHGRRRDEFCAINTGAQWLTVSRISATSSTDRAVVDPVSCRLGA